jgi:NAD(P)H dehydrogenase (quinone)
MADAPLHIVVLAHPDPESFNASVARTYVETVTAHGHRAHVRDLYRLCFDPVLKNHERPDHRGFTISDDVVAERAAIAGAAVYTLVYPIWFGLPPAILVGYIDRVFGASVTPAEIRARAGEGVLSGKRLMSIISSGTPDIWLDEQGQIEGLRSVLGRYLQNSFHMSAAEHLQLGHIVQDMPGPFVEQNLLDVKDRAQQLCRAIDAQVSDAPRARR